MTTCLYTPLNCLCSCYCILAVWFSCFVFFFQSHDCIRDSPLSRVLGDVCMRQVCVSACACVCVCVWVCGCVCVCVCVGVWCLVYICGGGDEERGVARGGRRSRKNKINKESRRHQAHYRSEKSSAASDKD